MGEVFEHAGHAVHIEVVGRDGRWGWWYSIDGRGVVQNMDRTLRSAKLALEEAKQAARSSIDSTE
jgi:hypothetical protein